ncbi:MAG: glutathione S-transferase N-terminal domain-containing protein [Actinobacteria bacterium]|nr:glutathione S-transferase N-terminal domain-containing protein [Actinomycetota bacterium]
MLTADERRGTLRNVRLYTFPGSNAGRTAELMLAHKGIAYDTAITPRGWHLFLLAAHGFRGVTVPALTIDGRRIQRTRVISRALDVWQPEPRLFPADPGRRAVVEQVERWGEDLQNAVRRLSYCATRRTGASLLETLGRSATVRTRMRPGPTRPPCPTASRRSMLGSGPASWAAGAQCRRLPDRSQRRGAADLRGLRALHRRPPGRGARGAGGGRIRASPRLCLPRRLAGAAPQRQPLVHPSASSAG